MSFETILRGIVTQCPGCIGAALMGSDGIPIAEVGGVREADEVSLLGVEFGRVLDEARKVAATVNCGELEEFVVAMGLSTAKRLAASMASQQQPQQLQMKPTWSRTFSPNCTKLPSTACASRSSPSRTSTRPATPWRMSEPAVALKVMQISMGAPQALHRCSILWRQ